MAPLEVNKAIKFESDWLETVHVNLRGVESTVTKLISSHQVTDRDNVKAWALKALTLTDLTTLAGDDTKSNVQRLCQRAAYPFPEDVLKMFDEEIRDMVHTAAVCVYPSRVSDAFDILRQMHKTEVIPIAAVATGFPSGQYPLKSRVAEIVYAIENGATEIDIVVDRNLVLNGKWDQLYSEIVSMRTACGDKAHLKSILAIGECGTMDNVYKASLVAMMAGSDFIKTSTGKEAVNATLPVGLVMIRAIQEFQRRTGKKIGLKPAGGVRSVKDAIQWITLLKETLGPEWIQPHLFRFGASGLLDDIEKVLLN